MNINIKDIRTDGGTQPRAEINWIVVADYANEMQEGATFPPVPVFYDGTDYWLADGFHRYHAAKKIGALQIAADVRQGTQRDAVLHSVGANATHGLRRMNTDKRRAVETLLRDEEWHKWSDREIARRCAVDNSFVSRLRAELTVDSPQSAIRRGADGRTINTANIGKPPSRPLKPEVQAALTDLAFQAPDDAPAFIGKALDEKLAPDAIRHATRIVTDPETSDALKEHILEPGEMMHDHTGEYAPSEPFRAFAQAVAETPEARSRPVDVFLRDLDGYRAITEDALTCWLDLADPADCELAEESLDRVCQWAAHVKHLIAQRRKQGLRIVGS